MSIDQKPMWVLYYRATKRCPFIPYLDVHGDARAHSKKSSVNDYDLRNLYGRGNVKIVKVVPAWWQ